ncbi:hypothetical protein [Solidesulfovibrio sp.]|uniref:hypothetical protein n=1 Tax=Solidesulfovibrio sp. TaxID=2910990 RepID=UPI002B201263|nr:hypothetical protein [Solidesulfovibrio sp.]MEA4856555.1 hypothetical protein [Solidesulfovibrio sp.]
MAKNRIKLTPFTAFGVQLAGEPGWRIGTRPGNPEELSARLLKDGYDVLELRVIGQFKGASDFRQYAADEMTLSKGWLIDPAINMWLPRDVPFVQFYEELPCLEIRWELEWFRWHDVKINILTDNNALVVWGDELIADPFPAFCTLASFVRENREGHVSVNHDMSFLYEFHVFNTSDLKDIVFAVRDHGNRNSDACCGWIYCKTSREKLYHSLTTLLTTAASHPDLVHQYLWHNSDDATVDAVSDFAEKAWMEKTGLNEVDIFDDPAYREFECQIVREKIPIDPKILPFVEKYIHMLSSLVVPEGWC